MNRPKSNKRNAYQKKAISSNRKKAADVAAKLNAVEEKFLDLSVTSAFPASNTDFSRADPTTVDCLNAMAQGDTGSTREGREIVLKDIELRLKVFRDPNISGTSARKPALSRVILFMDKQTNGAVPASVGDVMAVTASFPALSYKNLVNDKRFVILRDEVVEFDSPNLTYDSTHVVEGGNAKFLHWQVPLNNMKVTFTGTTGTIAAITDRSLHVLFSSDENVTMTLDYVSRLRYFG